MISNSRCVRLPSLLVLLALSCSWSGTALAADAPTPFQVQYRAEFMGMRASAERSLTVLDDAHYELRSRVRLRLLGKTITEINEVSQFRWDDERVWSQDYQFKQSGLGRRTRSVAFDWEAGVAAAQVNDDTATLPLEGEVFDELNALVGLQQRLAEGEEAVALTVIEKASQDQERYRIVAREALETALGKVETLRLEKVRGPDSERLTQIWLAPDWDYLLVKLYQRDPDGRELTLDLSEATLDGKALAGAD